MEHEALVVTESPLRYVLFGLVFMGGLILGGVIGSLAGYIKGRFDRKSERAVVLTDEQVERVIGIADEGKKPGGSDGKG